MLTKVQIVQYLTSQGLTLPDFLVDLLITQSAEADDCLAEHYSEATADLIRLYLITLLALGQNNSYITSQRAPSGASRSFQFKDLSTRWSSALAALRKLDTHGCVTGLIPEDPTQQLFGGIWTARGGCFNE